MTNRKIILLGVPDQSTNIVFNSLNDKFGIFRAIIEQKESHKVFLKRRIKRLGIFTVLAQIAFQIIISKPLALLSRQRVREILENYSLDDTGIDSEKLKIVKSVNAQSTIDLIKSINPDLIIVNGTRIISKKVLFAINCKFINIHAGITPKYRGVHGMYWALAYNDIENSGVTVHFVDEGIDTGNVIEQRQVLPTKKDNFTTYPLLQLSSGIKLLYAAVDNYFNNSIITQERKGESKLFYHPTIWQYLYYRYVRGVK